MIVVVTGLPASGKTTLARALARLLRLPLFSLDAVKEALYDRSTGERTAADLRLDAEAVLAALLADAPVGAVVDIWLDPARADRERLRAQLPAGTACCEIFCDVSANIAKRRYEQRHRHAMHSGPDEELFRRIDEAAAQLVAGGPGAPSGLGPLQRVDSSEAVRVADLAAWVGTLTEW